jgi:hypothetical protein
LAAGRASCAEPRTEERSFALLRMTAAFLL